MSLADQVPTGSGFAARSTSDDVLAHVDLTGRTALVTGGASGLGLETVRGLVSRGASVIVPVRNPARVSELANLPGVVTAPLDLGDLASVRSFAASMKARLSRLDLLVANAGIMACPPSRVGPGWEAQFGVNHLGHMALTLALLPLLRADARVVVLSSSGHKITDIRWQDPHFEHGYDKWQAYGQSKTANALFANALSRRLKPTGGLAFSVHPGGIYTPLLRHLSAEEARWLGWDKERGGPTPDNHGFKSVAQGAATTLWAATSPLLDGKPGVYCEDCDVAAPTDFDSPDASQRGVHPHAASDEGAERLWSLSAHLLSNA